jgi:Tol biopolymer transport system component
MKNAVLTLFMLGWMVGLASAQETANRTPLTIDIIKVIDVIETDLVMGPASSAGYLAPNGEIFAHIAGGSTLCIYDVMTLEQQRCFDLREDFNLLIDMDNVVWSWDSRYIAGHNDFFRMFRQPDIHIFDVITGDVTVINPDEEFTITDDDWGMIDVVPRWMQDGRLAFLRYTNETLDDSSLVAPSLMTYDVETETLETSGIVSIGEGAPYAIYHMDISHDNQTIVHNFETSRNDEMRGLWTLNIDGTNPDHIWYATGRYSPHMIKLSPDGKQILVYLNAGNLITTAEPEQSPALVIDITTGENRLIDPDHWVVGAGWSPDGSLLAYVVRDTLDGETSGLYITDEVGKAGKQILEGEFLVPMPYDMQALMWSDNNRLLITDRETFKGVIVQLGLGD